MSATPEKNVFILLTPHSYLNARELKYKLGLPEATSYIYFLTEHSESLIQINNLIDLSCWARILFLFGEKGRKIGKNKAIEAFYLIRNFIYIICLSQRIKNVRRLITGNILNPWMKFLISRSNAEEIIILDDGYATIPILTENNKIEEKFRIPSQLKKRKNWLLSRLQNSPVMNNRLSFFTVFDTFNDHNDLIKIRNNFDYLRRIAVPFKRTPEIFFIGSPLVDFGLISQEVFQKVMISLKKYFPDHEMIYFKHRTESAELPAGIKCISPDRPVEIYLLENKILPSMIVSFFSSAGNNLHRLYNDQIQIINVRIPDDYIMNPQYAGLLKVLSDYFNRQEKKYFRILDIAPGQKSELTFKIYG